MERSLAHDAVIGNNHSLRLSANGPPEFDVRTGLAHHRKPDALKRLDHLPAGHLRCARHGTLHADGRHDLSAPRPEVRFGLFVSVVKVETDGLFDVLAGLLERIAL